MADDFSMDGMGWTGTDLRLRGWGPLESITSIFSHYIVFVLNSRMDGI